MMLLLHLLLIGLLSPDMAQADSEILDERNQLNVTGKVSDRTTHGAACTVNGWDAPQYCMCKQGERISQFNSNHHNRYEDRKWDLKCANIPNYIPTQVKESRSNGWDGVFSWNYGIHIERNNQFLVGLKSFHSNRREDRIYTALYTSSSKWQLTKCSGWKYINNWDGPMNVFLKDFEVIAALYSYHSNHREDRRWQMRTCTLAHECSEIIDIKYDLRRKKVLQTGNVRAGTNSVDQRRSGSPAQYQLEIFRSIRRTLSESYRFESSTTNSVELTNKFSVGVKYKIIEASREIGINLKTSTTNTISKSNTEEYSEENGRRMSWTLSCPARTKCTSTVLVKQEKISIPYTITRKAPGSNKRCYERGNLIATNSFDATFSTVDDPPIRG